MLIADRTPFAAYVILQLICWRLPYGLHREQHPKDNIREGFNAPESENSSTLAVDHVTFLENNYNIRNVNKPSNFLP